MLKTDDQAPSLDQPPIESPNSVTDALTDEALRALQGNNAELFSAVYQAYAGQVLGYLTAKGVPDPEATTQDVFLAVLPRLDEIDGGVNGLRTFIFSVAHARMVDEHRKESRAPDQHEFEPERDARESSSAEAEAMLRLAPYEVMALLEHLGEDQREVLTLRIVAGLTVEQVAGIMGKTAGAVKQLQRRALIALREHSAVKEYVSP
ncbi:RNA polymerase sigma factor (sigma-70 family) [Paenarthrobacter histidinolovorans]|uniref:RNA polymerase sigma factor (Sigma-70 family) n=1 Tax=Paenarthrobacter histidinolovorans TaxID=43664 RepID=A0ABW8NAW0_9MICC